MPIGNQKLSELQVLLDPVMRYLKDNFNPHTSIRVDSEISEIVEGVAGLLRTDHVLDVAESNPEPSLAAKENIK